MNLKHLFRNFSNSTKQHKNIKASSLFEKWIQHPEVKKWEEKGWLSLEDENVLNYMLNEWEKRNEPIPPPHKVKANTIKEIQLKTGYDLFIETGTYLGKMIGEQKDSFKKIISIEVDPGFHKDADLKFQSYPHITCLLGDSGKVLGSVMKDISTPAVLWLDAHYNGKSKVKLEKECPIFKELDAIFSFNNLDHILLIDDARLFIGENDYPTIDDLKKYLLDKKPDYLVEVKNDIIRCFKKGEKL